MSAPLIEASLERAAELCEDLTGPVYARLFAEQPEMEPLFWRDTNHAIKGEMLSRVLTAILDFIGPRLYATTLIQCEVITHEGYDVPPDVFATFFGVVARTVADIIGPDWTPEIDAAWAGLLADLDYYVQHPDQAQTQAEAAHAF
jgi:hemoglobin-like flavoprotein